MILARGLAQPKSNGRTGSHVKTPGKRAARAAAAAMTVRTPLAGSEFA